MQIYYFLLSEAPPRHATNKRYYVRVEAESLEIAKEVFWYKFPTGYTGLFTEEKFKPSYGQILFETIKQLQR